MKKLISLALIVALALVLKMPVEASESCQPIYEAYCVEIGEIYGICPELLQSMCFYESTWNPKARNGNCIGIMQINPNLQKERMKRLGVADINNPRTNILLGADYLAELREEYEEPLECLMIYNMGKRGQELFEQGIYSQYAQKILDYSQELEREHGK